MEDRQSGRQHQRIADDQAGEDEDRCDERGLRWTTRQDDGEQRQQDGRNDETGSGAGAFPEVIGNECGMNPCADGAGEDDDVDAQLGERHVTITLPYMSLLCSGQLPQGNFSSLSPVSIVGAAKTAVLTSPRQPQPRLRAQVRRSAPATQTPREDMRSIGASAPRGGTDEAVRA